MSKPGPKRQPGLRYPGGKLKPESRRDAGSSPALVKRLFKAGLRGVEDRRFGSALGLYVMQGKITHRQFAAADEYAKLRGRFDRATQVPRRMTQSPSYGYVPPPDDSAAPVQRKEPMKEEDYVALVQEHTRLLHHVGPFYPALERAYVDDIPVAEDELLFCRRALDIVAEFFKMER